MALPTLEDTSARRGYGRRPRAFRPARRRQRGGRAQMPGAVAGLHDAALAALDRGAAARPGGLDRRPPGLDGQGRRRPTDGGMDHLLVPAPQVRQRGLAADAGAVEPLWPAQPLRYPATLQAIDDSQPPGATVPARKRLARRTPP